MANDDGWTPLFMAIDRNHVEIVQFLMDRGANVHATVANGLTTLMAATGNLDILRLLLDADVDIRARDDIQFTALHYAVGGGYIEAVRELIEEHNADMFAVDEDGYTPFDHIPRGFPQAVVDAVVDCLLQLFENKVTRDHGRLALHAILRSDVYSFAYVDDGANWHTPLNACRVRIRLPLGELKLKELLTLLQYVDTLDTELIRYRDDSGKLPIHIACEASAPIEVLTLVVEMDPATIHIADHTGSLPLHLLCCNSTTMPTDDASVRYLVEQEGGVSTLAARNHEGALPLHNLVASTNPPLRTVQHLIQSFSGAVAAQTNDGRYPFMVAACNESSASLSVVYELVRANPGLVLPR